MADKKQKVKKFISSPLCAFAMGGVIAALIFGAIYGWSVVWPWNVDWIWHGVAHDTAQHYLGWAFFASDSTGGTINGLAYPYGLSISFMDAIPLLAFPAKWLGLGVNIQYFGLWALTCFILMGGLSAILLRRIWVKVFGDKKSNSASSLLFASVGSVIFVLSPMMLARTLYHPALAAQWLILLAFLVIWDSNKERTAGRFVLIWSGLLILSVLIHPYFLPMMGAMMLISLVRAYQTIKGENCRVALRLALYVVVPVAAALLVFWAIGGFSLGGGAEVYDLPEKGFNLLSFFNPLGYSALIPGYANASSSPETLMWLGLGVLAALIVAAVLWVGNYRQSLATLCAKFETHRAHYVLYGLIGLALLLFAIGVRVDLGSVTLFSYQSLVPAKIYDLWTAFRAAAREAWPFYYLSVFAVFYWLLLGLTKHRINKIPVMTMPVIVPITMTIVVLVQSLDIMNSPAVIAKYEGFKTARTTAPEYKPIDLAGIKTSAHKHLIALDQGFRGNQAEFYTMGQTALRNNLTLNTGFFARVPERAKADQVKWRNKVKQCKLSRQDRTENLYFTNDKTWIPSCYSFVERSGIYIIQ